MANPLEAEAGLSESVPTSVLFNYLDNNAKRFGVDPSLAKAILVAENTADGSKIPSSIPTTRVSNKQARGLMQVIPATHEGLKNQGYLPSDHTLDDWRSQLDAGLAALKAKQTEQKTNDPRILAAAYNGGNEAAKTVRSGNLQGLNPETTGYLKKVDSATRVINPELVAQPSQGDIRRTEPVEPGSGAPTTTQRNGVEAIMATIENNGRIFSSLIGDLTNSKDAAALAKTQEAASIVAEGQAKAQEQAAIGAIEAANVHLRERILSILNMDTRAADNVVSRNMADSVALEAQRKTIAADIDSRMSVGFFDNPIQWLINQTILPGQVAAHNAIARKERDNSMQISTLQTQAEAQGRIDIAANADDIARRRLATANAEVASANAKAASARSQASTIAAQATLQVATLRARQADDEIAALKFQEIINDRREAAQLKENERAEREVLDRKIRIMGAAVGRPDMSLVALKSMSKSAQEMWANRATTGNFGDSFYESLQFVGKEGNLHNIRNGGKAEFADMVKAQQMVVLDKADKLRQEWPTKYPGVKVPTPQEAYKMAADDMEAEFTGARNNNLLTASSYNPYKSDHWKMATGFKGNPDNLIFKLSKDAYDKGQKISDKNIIQAVELLVAQRKMLPKDAAVQLSEYYQEIIKNNNRDRSITLMGLEAQKDYKVSGFGMNRVVDLSNVTSVENYFTGAAVKKIAAQEVTLPPATFGENLEQSAARFRPRRQQNQPAATQE